MRTISKLFAAALLVTAASPAFADHRDCDHDARPTAYPSPAPSPAGWRGDDRAERDGRWRNDGWRTQERARLRVEFARLEQQRSDFHARWGWQSRKAARFEQWYASERAELQRRWDALDWRYAAR